MPPMTGWMKLAVQQANKPKLTITETLRKRLSAWEVGRDRNVVHASDITKPNFCPRHWAFLDMEQVKKGVGSYVPTALRVTYDMGNATEKVFIEEWAGEAVHGDWRCRRCGDQRTMCTKPAPGCAKHKDCIWEYRQIRVESPVCGVSGSFDLLFDVGAPKLLLTELKTINPEDFNLITAPLPEHRLRTNLYLKLLAESSNPYRERVNLHEGAVLYVSRAYGKMHPDYNEILPFKEFTVKRDDEDLASTLARAKQLKIFREKGKVPSGICTTALDKPAKGCSTCKECFSGNYPAEQEALA